MASQIQASCMNAVICNARVHKFSMHGCMGSNGEFKKQVHRFSMRPQGLLHNDLSLQIMLADHFDRFKASFW